MNQTRPVAKESMVSDWAENGCLPLGDVDDDDDDEHGAKAQGSSYRMMSA
jgi:hypothetical protein